ncbi:MAG: DNA-3-methyladenine glycosylase 2 family protein [Acidobacteria bacterium]|nr:MAG: DNA-3-methyladenine glycosylase 2 family protein [Acidobacteriota bacterium]
MRKAVLHLKKSDPAMRSIIERIGACKMQFGEPTFHSLAEAIVYQQLNGKAALTIFKRFAALAGEPLTPAGILKLTPEQLRSVGLSKQKSSYLFDMSERADRGDLDFSRLSEMSDDEVIEHLTQVKGVGVWTAHMFLIFTLRRPNILPVGDFGVRMAMYKHYLEKKAAKNGHGSPHPLKTANSGTPVKKGPKRKIVLPKPEQMEKIAKRWEPYRSIACWYLWQSLDVKTIG